MELFVSSNGSPAGPDNFQWKAKEFGATTVKIVASDQPYKESEYNIVACLCYEELTDDDPAPATSFTILVENSEPRKILAGNDGVNVFLLL